MSEEKIFFFSEDIDFSLSRFEEVRDWLEYVVTSEKKSLLVANIVFCSDAHILSINREYLSHDYFTDIITFPLMNVGAPIEVDIFISIDTVRSNADTLGLSFEEELLRVIVHGFLHMLGYDDKSDDDKLLMRSRENFYLNIFLKKE